jgi:hypothetical protein
LPEVSQRRGLDAGRIPLKKVLAEAETHLRAVFDNVFLADPKANWVEAQTGMWVYLNHKLIASRGLEPETVAKTLAEFLAKQTGVLRTFTRAELETEPDPYDTIGKKMRKAYFPDRCGDVCLVPKPYWLGSEWALTTGTSHGTPHPYDTHVPLLVYGPGVKPGLRREEVPPAVIASIFAKALGIAPPAKAEYPTPAGLFGRE